MMPRLQRCSHPPTSYKNTPTIIFQEIKMFSIINTHIMLLKKRQQTTSNRSKRERSADDFVKACRIGSMKLFDAWDTRFIKAKCMS